MRIAFRTASKQRRLNQARVLAFLMLVGIVYEVILGSAHSHTDISSLPDISGIAVSVGQSGTFSRLPLHKSTGHDECLICRFHQQLSNSVVDARIFVAELPLRDASVSGEDSFDYSNSFAFAPLARHSGRAPPVA